MELETALKVFTQSFAFTRSFTHPYLVTRIGPLFVMADAPRRTGNYRNAELVTSSPNFDQVIDQIRAVRTGETDAVANGQPASKYALCVATATQSTDEQTRDFYKSKGWSLVHTEGFFSHSLENITQVESEAACVRVDNKEQLEHLNKVAGVKQILPIHLKEDSQLRQYFAEIDGQIVGWVRSVQTTEDMASVSNMFVNPEFRRRGIAKALMSKMLMDDKAAGNQASVLLASHAGAMLYPTVGYIRFGTLHVFVDAKPKKVI